MNLHDLIPTMERNSKAERDQKRPPTSVVVVVGGLPLVSLLPKEMLDASSRRASRRALLLAVAGVALITGAVIAASNLSAADSHAELDAQSHQLARLNAQVVKFGDLQREQQQIALGDAAVKVGGSTSIDWAAQITAVESVKPDAFEITSIGTTGAEPGKAFDQSTSPLDPARVATMTVTATATSITALPGWLQDLRSLRSYASATPVVTSGSGADSTTGYTVVITLNLDKDAFATRKQGETS